MAPSKQELHDLFWRAFWTAVQASTAILIGTGAGVVDVDVLQAAGIGAIGAVLSVAKSFAGQQLGQDATASSLRRV